MIGGKLLRKNLPGVGVGQIDGAGANGFDFAQNAFDLVVFFPERILAGHLLVVLPHIEIACAADKLAGVASLIAVVGVRPLGETPGIAVEQRVELVVVERTDFGFL